MFFCLPFRTNSDSALHQSTMTPAQQESFSGGSQDMQQKRGKQRKPGQIFVTFKGLYLRLHAGVLVFTCVSAYEYLRVHLHRNRNQGPYLLFWVLKCRKDDTKLR